MPVSYTHLDVYKRQGVDLLESILEKELFLKEVEVIKTDRGSEFSDAEGHQKKNVSKNPCAAWRK